jgi:hypothetical protein
MKLLCSRWTPGAGAACWLAAATPLASESYQDWIEAHFTAPQAAAGHGAPHADPDRDGCLNLLEYALGGGPANGAPLPRWELELTPPAVTCPALPERGDTVIEAEASADLAVWEKLPGPLAAAGLLRWQLPEGRSFARLRVRVADGAVIDSDGDGLHDLFEESLLGEQPGTQRQALDQVAAAGDGDSDGIPNILEEANRAPGPRSNPGPVLIDPRRVAAAVAAAAPRNPPALEVHTPLE